jgi:hypothetical protein
LLLEPVPAEHHPGCRRGQLPSCAPRREFQTPYLPVRCPLPAASLLL